MLLLQASIIVPYTGNLTMMLDSGANVTIPVNGTYQGTTYAQAVSYTKTLAFACCKVPLLPLC